MISLIVTLVAIVLVIALLLASLFYGGQALSESQAKARATAVFNQGHALLGVADVFRTEHGRWPQSLDELQERGYLRGLAQYEEGFEQGQGGSLGAGWEMPLPGTPVFLLTGVPAQVCSQLNAQQGEPTEPPPELVSHQVAQCYGRAQDDEAFRALFSKSPSALQQVLGVPTAAARLSPPESPQEPLPEPPATLQVDLMPLYFGMPSTGVSLSGNFSQGYSLGITSSDSFFLRVTNAGSAPQTVSILGSSAGASYLFTADNFETEWGYPAESAVSDYSSQGLLCRRQQPLGPGESCIIDGYLEVGAQHPTLQVATSTVRVEAPADISVFPGSGASDPGFYFVPGLSDSRRFEVLNNGASALTGLTLGVAGPVQFAVEDDCPSTLVPGGTCAATVRFSPTSPGAFEASLFIGSDQTAVVTRQFSYQVLAPAVVSEITLVPGSQSTTLQMTAYSGDLRSLMGTYDPGISRLQLSVSFSAPAGAPGVDSYLDWSAPLFEPTTYSRVLPALCDGPYGPCLGNSGEGMPVVIGWTVLNATSGALEVISVPLDDVEPDQQTTRCVAWGAYGPGGNPRTVYEAACP